MQKQFSVKKVLVDGQWLSDQVISINDGRIESITSKQDSDGNVPHFDRVMLPGFIDLQVNGGGGRLFNAQPELETLRCMTDTHRRFGTTGMLPTLITDDISVMQKSADAIAEAVSVNLPGVLGVHFEGPHLQAAKKGVHPEHFIRSATDAELALFTRKDLGRVLVTLAPDNVPVDIIRDLTNQGVKVCLGHSNASFDQTVAAIEAGADGFTHLFNAMSPLTSREPGVVGAALSRQDTYTGLILDHQHVHPAVSELAVRIKGTERMFLVTDAMAHVGYEHNELPYFDTVITRNGYRLTTPDGTLAGSCLDMIQAVVFAVKDLGVSLADAVAMAASTPADYMGLGEQFGRVAQGAQADFILTDDDLNIDSVYVAGHELYSIQES